MSPTAKVTIYVTPSTLANCNENSDGNLLCNLKKALSAPFAGTSTTKHGWTTLPAATTKGIMKRCIKIGKINNLNGIVAVDMYLLSEQVIKIIN